MVVSLKFERRASSARVETDFRFPKEVGVGRECDNGDVRRVHLFTVVSIKIDVVPNIA